MLCFACPSFQNLSAVSVSAGIVGLLVVVVVVVVLQAKATRYICNV